MKLIAPFSSRRNLRVPRNEWRVVHSEPVNVLLIGTTQQTSAFIAGLSPALPAPLDYCDARHFRPRPIAAGTLILQDATEMPSAQQHALLAWLEDLENASRVITAVRSPLFPQVEAGLFRDTLYYRLNTVTIDLSAGRTLDGTVASGP
jgi:hypothetical protein